MEASFLPKVEKHGRKRKEHSHSLLFDSAMTDKVMRQNAYEERLLLKRTKHIEKEKQQTLEEYNCSKTQFLLRFLPVMQRQNELRKDLLSKVFDSERPPRVKTALDQNRPLSSYPSVSSRTATANEKGRTSVRRTVSAELRFPALQETMDDILNGYRTQKRQPKSVSPTKMRLHGNWDLQSYTNDTQAERETPTSKNLTSRRKATTKSVGFRIFQEENIENTENMTDVTESFTEVSAENSKYEDLKADLAESGNKSILQEKNHCKTSEEAFSPKNLSNDLTRPKKMLNGERGDVDESISERNFSKQLKFLQQNNNLHEHLLNDLIHTLKSDTSASITSRFLAKMLNDDEQSKFPRDVKEDPGNLVPLRMCINNGVHLLSDVKKRQRHDAQRLRIMRTIVLAYDAVWNKRVKKISAAA